MISIKNSKKYKRKKRHSRKREKLLGSSIKPRISIYRSNKAFYTQVIDDEKGHILIGLDTRKFGKKNKETVEKLAEELVVHLRKKEIKKFHFDSSGYLYHGLVKHFSQAIEKEKF